MKMFLICFLTFSINTGIYSQKDTVQMVVFDTEFKFTDGIYLSFEQVKRNMPLVKSRIIANIETENPDFFDNVLSKNEISYYDDKGMKQSFPVTKLWGYSKNGTLYVRMDNTFNKITYVGSICHFIATINVTYQSGYDPYYYNPYYYSSGWNSTVSTKTELRQFMLDFNSGKIVDYDEKNLEALLTADPKLHDEYSSLGNRKRKNLKFYYIRKFNEQNPLKIPIYTNENY